MKSELPLPTAAAAVVSAAKSATTEPASCAPQAQLSAEELRASLQKTLASWDGQSPIWVFAYGSLIWKPEFDYDCRVAARVFGYHRKLCLRSIRYRGTFEYPGVVAGLDRGGSCAGIAYRLPAQVVHTHFERLWQREMFMGSYAAHWLNARFLKGEQSVNALAFVVRRDSKNYCGQLDEEELLTILTRACGVYGSSLDYLLRTVEALKTEGLRDAYLERLALRVTQRCGSTQ